MNGITKVRADPLYSQNNIKASPSPTLSLKASNRIPRGFEYAA